MAETIAELKIQLKLDGANAVAARFSDIGRVTGELKAKLSEIGAAIKAAQAAGDPLKVEALKAAGREIEAAIGQLGRLREAIRIDHARGILDVRPWRDIQREIDQARAAYARLAASGKLSMGEQAQAFAHLQHKIAELKAQTNGWAQSLEKVRGALAGLAAGGAAFGIGVRNAVNFETAMVGVQRAASLTRAETEALGREFQRMSTRIAMGANDIARIAAMGSKFGVAKADIARFAELTAIAARQFEMLPDEAGRSLGMLSRLLGVSIKDMDAFIGMLNASADAVGVAERDIIQTLTLAGASAQQFGLTTNQATALATAFLSVGATAEQAGTAMRSLLSRVQAATQDSGEAGRALKALVGDTQAFSQTITRDAQGALNQLLSKLAELGREDRFAAMKAIFQEGLDTENISKLVAKLDQYKAAQDTAGKSADDFRAQLDKLNDTDLGTLGAEFQKLKNAAENLGTSLGQTIAPAVRAIAIVVQEAAIAVKSFVDAFPNLSAALGIFTTLAMGAGALRIAMGGVVMLFGKIATAALALLNPLKSAGVAVAALGGSAPLLSRLAIAFRALIGPIGLVTAAIMLGVDAWNLWKKKAQEASNVQPGGGRFAGRGASGSWGGAQGGKQDADGALRAALEWDQLAESLKKPNQKMAEEIERIKALGVKLKKPADEIGRMIAAVREKYAGKSAREDKIQIPALRRESEAWLIEQKAMLDRDARLNEAAWEGKRISAERYYAELDALARRDAELNIRKLEQDLAAQREHLERLRAMRAKSPEDRERIRAEIDETMRTIDEISARIRARQTELKTELEARAMQSSRIQFEQAEAAMSVAMERMRAQEQSLRIEREAGLISETQLRQRLIDLHRQTAGEVQKHVNAMERLAGDLGDEYVNKAAMARNEWSGMASSAQEVTAAMRDQMSFNQAIIELNQANVDARHRAGITTDMEHLREQEAANRRQIELLRQEQGLLRAMGDEAGAMRIEAQIIRLSAQLDLVADKFRQIFEDNFATFFEALLNRTKSFGEAWKDLWRGILREINRLLARELSQQLMKLLSGKFGSNPSLEGRGLFSLLSWIFPGTGSGFRLFASGGPVPGTGTGDTVPALLTPGEYVLRRDVAQRIGHRLLDAINGGGWLPQVSLGRLAFASGGAVPDIMQGQAVPQSIRIVNTIDPSAIEDWATSAAGERVILNVIGRNPSRVRHLLGAA